MKVAVRPFSDQEGLKIGQSDLICPWIRPVSQKAAPFIRANRPAGRECHRAHFASAIFSGRVTTRLPWREASRAKPSVLGLGRALLSLLQCA